MRGIGALLVSSRPGGALEALAGSLERRTGLRVATVADGREALSLAVELIPALVLTELMMVGLDGLELCRALRREPALRGCRVLVTSTLCAERRALEAGADAFLQIPCAHGDLAAAALQLLGRAEAGAEATLQA
jgi:CheY-like chemotaxis protein